MVRGSGSAGFVITTNLREARVQRETAQGQQGEKPSGARGQITPMAGRTPKTVADQRKQAVAVDLASAAPQTAQQLAKKLGVSPDRIADIRKDPEVKAIAQGMLEPHRARLAALVPKAIGVIEKALEAKIGTRTDHITRLRATDRLRKMVELVEDYDFRASEVAPPTESTSEASAIQFRGTLEDLLIEYRRVTLTTKGNRRGTQE